jgi:geranylgeranyl diphosphate synthase type II
MYTFEELKDIFLNYTDDNQLIDDPKGLYTPVNYLMKLPGKRIRPVACLMTANIFNLDVKRALPVAYAIEMFHNFTLMHDDIMDNADMRRANKTVHIKYGVNTAILSGDLMMIMSYKYLIDCCEDLMVKDKILKLFTQTAIEVCEGQQYDMDFEIQEDVSLGDYLLMIKLKTAVLLAATFKAGAIIGGANDEDTEHFYKFGLNLGLAFQIQDDYLDTYGDQNTFGKKIGGDIVQNKKTYLYIKALELADIKTKNDLKNIYKNDNLENEEKIALVKEIYKRLNIQSNTQFLIKELTKNAFDHYNTLSISSEKLVEIKRLTEYLLKRIL